jgi:hypothetical protein
VVCRIYDSFAVAVVGCLLLKFYLNFFCHCHCYQTAPLKPYERIKLFAVVMGPPYAHRQSEIWCNTHTHIFRAGSYNHQRWKHLYISLSLSPISSRSLVHCAIHSRMKY